MCEMFVGCWFLCYPYCIDSCNVLELEDIDLQDELDPESKAKLPPIFAREVMISFVIDIHILQ